MDDGHFREPFDGSAFNQVCAERLMESIKSMASHWNNNHVGLSSDYPLGAITAPCGLIE